MTVNYIAPLQQALLSKLISNGSNSSTNNNISNLLSCLGNSGNSTDLSPILKLSILSSCCSNNNNNIFSSFMNILSNYFMQIMMMSFLKDLFSGQTTTAASGSQTGGETSGTAASSCCTPQTASTVPASPETIRDAAIAIEDINDKNIDSTLKNQKGTSFVIVCGDKCGRCKEFEPMLESINSSLGTKATFYNLSGSDKNANRAYLQLKNEAKASAGSYSYPIVIKCVDGVAQKFYDYNDIKNIFKSESKITEWFSEKI